MADLELKNIQKAFKSQKILNNIDLKINDGEFVVILGNSGCGKTTLLRIIAGLEHPDAGLILIDNCDITEKSPSARQIAMVFQSYALYPHLNVRDNLGFGLKMQKFSKSEIKIRIDEVAELLEVTEILEKKPFQLSGGQQQRVAIGRAIVRRPKILLMDEPLSNLDSGLRSKLRYEFRCIAKKINSTIIYVTHDQNEALSLADKILLLNDGIIEQFGTPDELFYHPSNINVAKLIGTPRMNFIGGMVKKIECNKCLIELKNGKEISLSIVQNTLKIGDRVQIGIRPNDIEFCENGKFDATCNLIENQGAFLNIHLSSSLAENEMIAQVSNHTEQEFIGKLNFNINEARIHLFDTTNKSVKIL